jgi:hypothetical protein
MDNPVTIRKDFYADDAMATMKKEIEIILDKRR